MARESSILKLKGKLDGMSFYKTSEGYHVRAKGGISRERIMNDHNFVRTRENMDEFSNINKAGKLIREGIGTFLNRAKDTRTGSRLVSVIAKIKNLDTVSDRGERTFGQGIRLPEGKLLLEGFGFNKHASLDSILKANYTLDTEAGSLSISGFSPAEDLAVPPAATHVTIGYACSGIDPEALEKETVYAERAVIPVNAEVQDIALALDALPKKGTVKIHLILVEFLQEMNGKMYPLKNGSYNALQIVKVV